MKRKTLTLLALAAATAASAAPRTLEEARLLAEQALTRQLGHAVQLEAQPQRAAQRGDRTDLEALPYYHFCQEDAFVLIAGSDLLPAVIGYGDNAMMQDERPLPPNMQEWLNQVEAVEAYLEANPEAAEAQRRAMAVAEDASPITPIMDCRWGQDYPFNELCPMAGQQHAAVGCMATALSQIIYTQQFPAMSHGQVSYKNMGQTIMANLEGVTYDYAKMSARYTSNSTAEQRAEVAKLCYNVGIASMMQYGEMSGTISLAALEGVIRHFGMTKASFLHRYYYSLDEWNAILQDELRQGNPLLFAAQSTEGGHAFVVDGMNASGLYHVNWGWDGYLDGYFDISLLRAGGAGTGATENDGFYMEQEALVGLCDPERVNRWHCPLGTVRSYYYSGYDNIDCTPKSNVQRGTKLTLKVSNAISYSCLDIEGHAGIQVLRDGELFAQELATQSTTLPASKAKVYDNGAFSATTPNIDLSASWTIPADLADGIYTLYLVFQPDGESQADAVRQYHYRPSCWTMTVSNGNVQLSHESIGMPFEAGNWSCDSEPIKTGPSTLTCTVTNTGTETMAARFFLRLTGPNGKKMADITDGGEGRPQTLAPGATHLLSFDVNSTLDGEYTAQLLGTPMGIDTDQKTLIDTHTFAMEADPTRTAELTLLEAPILLTETVNNGQEVSLKLRIKNTRKAYDGQMAIRFFSKSNSTADSNLKAEIMNESVQIGEGATTEVTITGILNVPNMTKNTALYARAYYLYGDEMLEMDGSKPTTVRVYATTGIAEVVVDEPAEDLSKAEIYDVLGKRVQLPASGQLRKGIYIINGRKRVIN